MAGIGTGRRWLSEVPREPGPRPRARLLEAQGPLRDRVTAELRAGRSPWAVRADLVAECAVEVVCVETIYATVYAGALDVTAAECLRSRRRRRRGRRARHANARPALPNIAARPAAVNDRVVTGAMAEALGHGGQKLVVEASGISTSTMSKAVHEVRAGVEPSDRQRAEGGGDRPAIDKHPGLADALDELVHPDTRGNPMSPLRWTLKSTYELARDLTAQGFKVSAELVRRLLHQMGYSLQATAKQNEGSHAAPSDRSRRGRRTDGGAAHAAGPGDGPGDAAG